MSKVRETRRTRRAAGSSQENEPPGLACLEVWGGNASVDRCFVLMGLDAWLYSEAWGDDRQGGDVYYLSSCATGRITRLLLADVSGHGLEASAPAVALRTLMRRHANQLDQRRLVAAMNHAFTAEVPLGVFATASVATYFAPTRTLSLTSAGHPPPLRFQGGSRIWEAITSPETPGRAPADVPMGISANARYEQATRHLGAGDLVLFYSDALIECRDRSGKNLGVTGLIALLDRLDATPAERLVPTLLDWLRSLEPGNLQRDDTTLLLVRPNDRFETSYRTLDLGMHRRAIAELVRAFARRGEPVPWPDLHPANLGGALMRPLNGLWGRRSQKG